MASSPSSEREPLVCPRCGTAHPVSERFCARCAMPLVYAAATAETDPPEPTERQARARKIKPQLAEGRLVKVASARHQAEAEFVQGLLLEEGVPSTLRRARGFDVPDMLAAGPRDVLVPASGAASAREVLLQSELDPLVARGPDGTAGGDTPGRILVGLLAACLLVGLIAWAGTQLLG